MKMYAMPKKLLKNVIAIRNEKAELPMMNFKPSNMSRAGFPLPPLSIFGIFSATVTSAIVTKPEPAMKNDIEVPR